MRASDSRLLSSDAGNTRSAPIGHGRRGIAARETRHRADTDNSVMRSRYWVMNRELHVMKRPGVHERRSRSHPVAKWRTQTLRDRRGLFPGKLSAARHRLSCLEPMTKSKLTDKQRFLLVSLVETYIQLDDAAQEEYQALLADQGHEEVAAMEMTWAGKIAHEARETALQEGREEGKRDLLLEQLEHRFGRLPRATVNRVNALTSSEELSRLAARVLDAPSLEDLGL